MEAFAKGLVAGLAAASDDFAGSGLYQSCEEGDLEKIKVCLANPEAVNYRDPEHGNTPLIMLVATHDWVDAAALLIENNADVNETNSSGLTVLGAAARHGNLETVHMLLARGALPSEDEVICARDEGHDDIAALIEAKVMQRKAKAPSSAAGSAMQVLLMQISFASEDAMEVLKYRDFIQQYSSDGRFCELIECSVMDSSWLPRWKDKLAECGGALIVFSDAYRAKLGKKGTPLAKEAAALRARRDADPAFRLYVLDPRTPGHGPADLGHLLRRGEVSMNEKAWVDFIASTANAESIGAGRGRGDGRGVGRGAAGGRGGGVGGDGKGRGGEGRGGKGGGGKGGGGKAGGGEGGGGKAGGAQGSGGKGRGGKGDGNESGGGKSGGGKGGADAPVAGSGKGGRGGRDGGHGRGRGGKSTMAAAEPASDMNFKGMLNEAYPTTKGHRVEYKSTEATSGRVVAVVTINGSQAFQGPEAAGRKAAEHLAARAALIALGNLR